MEDVTLFDGTWCIESLSNATFLSSNLPEAVCSLELCSLIHDVCGHC